MQRACDVDVANSACVLAKRDRPRHRRAAWPLAAQPFAAACGPAMPRRTAPPACQIDSSISAHACAAASSHLRMTIIRRRSSVCRLLQNALVVASSESVMQSHTSENHECAAFLTHSRTIADHECVTAVMCMRCIARAIALARVLAAGAVLLAPLEKYCRHPCTDLFPSHATGYSARPRTRFMRNCVWQTSL